MDLNSCWSEEGSTNSYTLARALSQDLKELNPDTLFTNIDCPFLKLICSAPSYGFTIALVRLILQAARALDWQQRYQGAENIYGALLDKRAELSGDAGTWEQ